VRAFQELTASRNGIADAATLAAMNVPLDDRIHQVELNLERWRWMPDDFGTRHLLVNIPQFLLTARENGKPVMDIRVVVGKADEHKTRCQLEDDPRSSSVLMEHPRQHRGGRNGAGRRARPSLFGEQYRDPGRLEVGATPVDYASVNWDDAEQLKHLAFRQRPGAGNALGHVKFLFPNEFDVYLHDTPADALFARRGAHSAMAASASRSPNASRYVLRGDPEWDDARILEAMNAGVEKHVKLQNRFPSTSCTSLPGSTRNSGLHFQSDVYGYDAAQAAGERQAKAAARRLKSGPRLS